jgi:PST family polysaccharide transporter
VAAYALGYGLVGIVLAAAGWGVWALVAGQMAQTVIRTAWVVALRPPRRARLGDGRSLAELLYFGGGFTLAKVANFIAVQGDNLVVARALGPTALGVYGRAYALMSAPAYGFGTVLDNVLFPAMARIQHDPERLAAAYRRGVALLALLVLPPSVVLILVAPEFIRVALGPRWDAAVAPFQVLAIGMLFRTSYKISDSLARATGAVYRRAWRQALYAGLVVAGAAIGQFWGVLGVAWGALVALTVNFALMAQLSLRLARFPWSAFRAAHAPAAWLTLVTTPPAWAVAALLRNAGAPALLVLAGAAAAGAAMGLAAVARAPKRFLGADGAWITVTLRDYAARFRRRGVAGAPAGA